MHRESSRNPLSRAQITQCDKIARISDIGYTHICDMRTTFSDVHFMAVVRGTSCVSAGRLCMTSRVVSYDRTSTTDNSNHRWKRICTRFTDTAHRESLLLCVLEIVIILDPPLSIQICMETWTEGQEDTTKVSERQLISC